MCVFRAASNPSVTALLVLDDRRGMRSLLKRFYRMQMLQKRPCYGAGKPCCYRPECPVYERAIVDSRQDGGPFFGADAVAASRQYSF